MSNDATARHWSQYVDQLTAATRQLTTLDAWPTPYATPMAAPRRHPTP